MRTKLVHLDKVEFTADYIDGDIIKFETKTKDGETLTEYSKIIKVKARIDDKNVLWLSYVTENGKHIEHAQIKELVKKYYA